MPITKQPKKSEPLWKEWDYKAQKKGVHHTVYSVNGDRYTGEWDENKKNVTGGEAVGDCTKCDLGHYCNGTGKTEVSGICAPGYFCLRGAKMPKPNNDSTGGICPRGHFCVASQQPEKCAPGYHAAIEGKETCDVCSAGTECLLGTVNPPPCPQGYYCLIGSANDGLKQACPVGTFGNRTGLRTEGECTYCLGGHYCETPALKAVTGLCSAGYFCLKGAKKRTPPDDPDNNPKWFGECPEGGYYCEEGVSASTACPRGTFAPGVVGKLTSMTDCTECTAGHYCELGHQDAVTGPCDPGYYCLKGSPTKRPNSSHGDICPPGFHCPQGSSWPQPCLPGSYNNASGQATCQDCPEGFYCSGNTTTPIECPSGYYCPQNTPYANDNACPEGTFNSLTGRSAPGDCVSCTAGYYCDKQGQSNVTDLCDEGYYCSGGTTAARPATKGGKCLNGTYCPKGSSQPLTCPERKFCGSEALPAPSGNCAAGFFCHNGSKTDRPTDGITGDECPAGYYCPSGSASPTPCPPGTYSNATRNRQVEDCANCTSGYYCEGFGNTKPTNLCDAGFYCPPGQKVRNPNGLECTLGHFCPTGSKEPLRCESGTYQDTTNQASCEVCPEEFYCDNRYAPVVLYQNSTCPPGQYCPNGTKHAYEFPCPVGTFSGASGLSRVSECSPCPGGYYCDELGQTTYTKQCDQGYFCRSGATVATPEYNATESSDNTTALVCPPGTFNYTDAGPCPAGFYCPVGTAEPEKCPPGTFSNKTKLFSVEQCANCTAGKYCETYNLVKPTGPCREGYYCPTGTSRADQIECPAGRYCPEGTYEPVLCPNGTFRSITKGISISDCFNCTPGYYCQGVGLTNVTAPCVERYYCPGGNKVKDPHQYFCTVGHFCPGGTSEPIPCQNNSFAKTTHAKECSLCPAGFFCKIAGVPKNCTQGYYCPYGTGIDLKPCPKGTYGAQKTLERVSQCKSCDPGKYCAYEHATNYTGDCASGHWCAYGVDRPDPIGDNITAYNASIGNDSCPHYDGRETGYGGICPIGHYCPKGSKAPLLCPARQYCPVPKLSEGLICLEGYYCPGNNSEYESRPCPQGYYCPNGTSLPYEFPCPAGTYNNRTRRTRIEDCVSCSPGFYCPVEGMSLPNKTCAAGYFCRRNATSASPDQGEDANICPVGHYCPKGTGEPNNCPLGTFGNDTGYKDVSECWNCTAGFHCSQPGRDAPIGPCDAGYYCPPGSSSPREVPCYPGTYCVGNNKEPELCPIGTYQPNYTRTSINDCINCTAGFYCSTPGQPDVSGPCKNGSYCPTGSSVQDPHECRIGFHCPLGSATPKPCPAGSFTNSSGRDRCDPCPNGFYCFPLELAQNESVGYRICPRGFYCSEGTGLDWHSCPAGTYSDRLGLYSEKQCKDCDAGKFCDGRNLTSPTDFCAPGYYCTIGVSVRKPYIDGYNVTNSSCPNPTFLGQYTGIGDICPPGTYCVEGSNVPKDCPAGTYNDESGQKECKPCPSGYYCLGRTVTYINSTCPSGHYCPINTTQPYQFPCQPGTFNNLTGQKSISSCVPCIKGSYCEGDGNSWPTGLCSAGWYCNGSATSNKTTTHGGQCQPGYYCREGSVYPRECDGGKFCDVAGLSEPKGNCSAGYYCKLRASTSTPSDGTGGKCPPGHYCPEGSTDPFPCDPGTYYGGDEGTSPSVCVLCTDGSFCNTSGLDVPDGQCSAGYYCPAGQSVGTPSAYVCPRGNKCTAGSGSPTKCESGYYQDELKQDTCKECPERYYCNATFSGVENYNLYVCPEGFYCTNGTRYAEEFPCEIGTFNNLTGRASQSECTHCLPRYYCGEAGLSHPRTLCSAGYYCKTGAKSATPNQGNDANECPTGRYCPEGTDEPELCPSGTFSNALGLHNSSQCTPCTEGFYCEYPGWTNETGLCQEGYFCIKGSTSKQEQGCPAGKYCPKGTHIPKDCPVGTFSNTTGLWKAEQCTNCTAGSYCFEPGRTYPTGPCRAGYYCPTGSSVDNAVPCPIGLHCPQGSDTPKDCPAKSFTNATAQSSCQDCPEGYYCVPENVTAGDPKSGYHACPRGYYCPSRTGLDWKACPLGTFSNRTHLSLVTQCEDCPGGKYCGELHAIEPTGDCYGGYYCESGVDKPDPVNSENGTSLLGNCSILGLHTGFGGKCPTGHYCRKGSTLPEPCPQGSYQDKEGQTNCKPCPAGYYCLAKASTYNDTICPSGSYCPLNTSVPILCDEGTFNSLTGQTEKSNCVLCTAGKYCRGSGLSKPTADCYGGWYCVNGSTKPTPDGARCPVAHYCPNGSALPIACDPGKYCPREELSEPEYDCEAGYFCTSGASQARPTDGITGDVCPKGTYCPRGIGAPINCPMGTFLNSTGNRNVTDCQDCTPGWYCGGSGLPVPTAQCAPGYYCTGRAKHDHQHYCPRGHKCLMGSSNPEPCDAGYYQNDTTQSTCRECPRGFYCNDTNGPVISYGQYICIEGHYCPGGTRYAEEFKCPPGTFNNRTGMDEKSDCLPCTGGFACDEWGLVKPNRLCGEGYFCREGANTTTPNLGDKANICPGGFYCPEGVDHPIVCPAGTFSPTKGLQAEHQCLNCTGGEFCNKTSMTATAGPCKPGYYCPSRSTSDEELPCPPGRYCGLGTFHPSLCPSGTYSNGSKLQKAEDCTDCRPGYYCDDEGLTAPKAQCDAGYYCPKGQNVSNPFPCPAGKHCPQGSAEPQHCAAGTFAESAQSSVCTECPEGFYCVPGLVIPGDPSSAKHDCPEGFYCPNGTGADWKKCPPGTYSNRKNLVREQDCTPCPGGKYCGGANLTEPSGNCSAGYFCVSGAASPNPYMTNLTQCPAHFVHITIGNICPRGHFCKAGSELFEGCPTGYYQDMEGQPNCKKCPRGFYCYANSTTYIGNECPTGHYCPDGTPSPQYKPCRPGTYNPKVQGNSSLDCLPCDPGHYCAGYGNDKPTNSCSAGFYCPGGDEEAKPGATRCTPGHYCKQGSHNMTKCTPGYYCDAHELHGPAGQCDPGYYCPLGSSSRRQIECIEGHYCPLGSPDPEACQPGYYLPGKKHENVSECIDCIAGMFCNSSGLSYPDGPCDKGYFCPPGQSVSSPNGHPCPVGHFCIKGSPVPERCPNGTYESNQYSYRCDECLAGYYCDNTAQAISDLTGFECPMGHFCPPGTSFATQHKCPTGTWSNKTQLERADQCTECPPRYYCQQEGLPEPEAFCLPGYYCNGSAKVGNPFYAECPIGHYCPEGSYIPTPCPRGSFANSKRNQNVSDCKPCSPGYYCDPNATIVQERPCDPGFVCILGSTTPRPTDGIEGKRCPKGHYCTKGTAVEEACPAGEYGPTEGLSECLKCPPGYTCPNTSVINPDPCSPGHYCPGGVKLPNGEPCPSGTYLPQEFRMFRNECLLCPPGKYCELPGQTNATGPCRAGFLCRGGAKFPAPNDTRNAYNGPCPPGYYCEEGTTNGTMCPEGTLRPYPGAKSRNDCLPCTGGKYCSAPGLLVATSHCGAGYYCPAEEDIRTPFPSRFQCPRGHFCPNGTANPYGCDPGTYQGRIHEASCDVCPEGYFCPANTSDPLPCPARHYCPNGTHTPVICPNGTYTDDNASMLSNVDQCKPCDVGHYCQLGVIADNCSAGYLCYIGSPTPTPDGSNKTIGEPCHVGYYCPAGTHKLVKCEPGLVIPYRGARSKSECQTCPAGKICSPGSSIPEACTVGYYCPYNDTRRPCPLQTFNNVSGATDISFCHPCPAGYYCWYEALADYTTSPCPVGQYCPNATDSPIPCPNGTFRDSTGARNISECHLCPAGRFCPLSNSSFYGYECPNGTFCPPGRTAPAVCLAGYFCHKAETQLPCPEGYYCPKGSPAPIKCPEGHYCDPANRCYNDSLHQDAGACCPTICPLGYSHKDGAKGKNFNETCEICRPGHYGNDTNRSVCKICRSGVICLEGATTDTPGENDTSYGVNKTNSYPCPMGHYCEQGDLRPRPCPNGTYNNALGARHSGECKPCARNHFNDEIGQEKCKLCGEGTARSEGSDTCSCEGQNRIFKPSQRTCECEDGHEPISESLNCVPKTYGICVEDTWRNDKGVCWNSTQWEEYCNNTKCQPLGSVGFVGNLGICKCKVVSTDDICNNECRNRQRFRVVVVCSDPPALKVTPDAGEPILFNLSSLSNVPNFKNTFDCADGNEFAINFAVLEGGQMQGAYDVGSQSVVDLLNNAKQQNEAGQNSSSARRRRRAVSSFSFKAVPNPTVCLTHGSHMIWKVSNSDYPKYDKNSLFNTNPSFDDGPFKDLEERHQLESTRFELFAYKFDKEGVYVFSSSKNPENVMMVRVMAKGAQCAEDGPFFSTTPRVVIQNGIAISRNIVIMPDWVLIGAMLGSFALLMLILLIGLLIFRQHGWKKVTFKFPRYRVLAQRYNFDDYSSKGSTVHPVKKYHRNLEGMNQYAQEGALQEQGPAVDGEVKGDEFWDYDQQVDMEGFTSGRFYGILAKQSREVTGAIARQKDQAKQLYQKINHQTESLKGLWIAKLNLRGRAAMATPEDLRAFEAKKGEVESELERRKELGFNFQQILQRQKAILEEDEEAREAHLVAFEASLREAVRTLKSYSENRGKGDMIGDFNDQLQHRVGSRVDAILQRLSVEIQSECQRRGAWALIGDVTGARLCTLEGELLGLDYLFDSDGTIRAPDLVTQDTHTGLLIPSPQTANMLLADNVTNVPVPPNFFVHQSNGRVMPIEGNVAYDPLASRLTITADSTNADAATSAEMLIPYIPYPNNPETGLPVKTTLTPVEKRGDMRLNGRMICGNTGLPVPILGMTIHPETGNAYPIGGCHADPVTGLPVAIEIGSMMLDPNTGRPAPIVGVTIDPRSGNVIPLGGTPGDSERGDEVPLLFGDSFSEPLSGRRLKVTSARLVDDGEERELEPMGGGYQYVLDVGELYYEYGVLDALEAFKEAITGPDDLDGRQELSMLDTAQKDLHRARSKVMTYLLRNVHDIMRREERSSLLADSGGSPGMYEFSATGQLLPILVGTTMRDASGTDLEVPILGIDKNHETDTVIPLGGSLEDPGGEGLVPIMIGEKAVDPVTGVLSTICGVKMNQEFGVTEPVTLSSSTQRKRRPPPGSVALLEEELAGRRSFWRRQRHREDELTELESKLYRQLMEDEHVTAYQVQEQLENIQEETASLADAAHREVQRRTEASVDHAAGLPPDVVAVLTMFDALERQKEESHNTAHNRFADSITRFFDKLQTEETKYNNRMEELQGALNPEAEAAVTERFQQSKARLRNELQDQLQSRMEQLDEEHSTLEYVRNKAEISALEAKLVLTGGAVIAGEYEVVLPGIYGDDLPLPESNRELLPLLQRLIRLLEEGMPVLMNSAGQVVGGGYAVLGGGAKFDIISAGAAGGGSGVTSVAPTVFMTPTGVTTERTQKASPMILPPEAQRNTMGTTISATEILSKLEVGQMGEKFSSEAVNIAEIAASGGLTEEKRKEITKNLMEKHTLECAQLENELRSNEIKVISEVIQAYEERKTKAIANLQEELREKLRRAESEEEKEALMKEYSDKMADAQDDIEQQKQKKLRDIRKLLKEERKRRKKDLYNRHKEEARAAGVSDVIDLDLPDEDELDRELILLAQQQEKLLAELALAYEQENEREREEMESGRRAAFDKEMEARVKAMNLSVAPEEIEGAFEEVRELHSRAASRRINMKDKMKERKDRKRSKKTEEELQEELKRVTPGSPEEAEILAALEERRNADMRREEGALLAVLAEVEAEQEDTKRKQVVQNLLQKTEMTEEEQRQVVAKYLEEAEEMKERYNDMQKHSQAVLAAKLAARRRIKEEMRKEAAMKKGLKEMSKKQAELSGDEPTLQLLEAAEAQVADEVSQELAQLAEKQMEHQAALDVKQAEEMLALEENLKAEEQAGGQQVADQIEEQKIKLMAAKQDAFEKEMSQKRDDMSQEQADMLLEQHRQELEFLSRSMDVEKQRQVASLADKIAERKKRKAAALQQRHKAEMAKELMNQQEERQKVEDDKVREAQKSALIDAVQNMDSEQAGNTIYQVLQQRHMRERVQLEEQFSREIAAAKAEARAQMAETRQAEREEMVADQEKEFMELIAKSNSMSTAELSQKKAELKLQHKKQLAQFDAETQEKLAQAELDTVPSLEVKHAHARLELREKQLQELAGTMSELSSEEELIKNYTEEAERASQAAKEYREQTMFEMAEKINKIKAQRQQQSEEQKKKMDEEVKRLEAELEKEREREEMRLAEREAERAAKRLKTVQESEAAKQLAMAQRGMTEEEKEKLMREHQESMAKFEANLKKEQEKTKAALREKLEARRKKKKDAEMQKIKATAKIETEAAEKREREEMTALQKHEAELLKASTPVTPKAPSDTRKKATEDLPITETLLTSSADSASAAPVITAGLPAGVSEQDWVSMLIGSPIFDSVNEIENMLKNNIGEGGVAGAKGGRPYIDIKDAQWLCRGDLVPVDINELSPANFVVYRFGVFITQMLHKAMDTPEVTLLLASNLPPNNYERNAFRNSFFYEHARRVLFVRQERMESVGDFLVVIMHALSHIKTDDLVDDQNPRFLREFYKAIRICCQDMFFARSRNTPTAQGLVGNAPSASPLEAAFKPTRSMTERVNVVGELVNIKVSSPIDADFSVQGITERLARKNAFLTRAKLKEYLSSAHVPSSKKEEFAMSRLKELRGEKSSDEQKPKPRTGVKTGLKSPKELLQRQINDLEGRVDSLNTELAQVLKTESDLNVTVNEMEQDSNIPEERLQILREQLTSTEQRKDNLLMKVDYLEEEIVKKTKELKALK